MDISQFSKHIQFRVDQYPDGYTFAFERYLYNDASYLKLKGIDNLTSYYIIDVKKTAILGRVHFRMFESEAISLPGGPFGGMEIDPDMSIDLVDEFVCFFERKLKAIKAEFIKITQFPLIYADASAAKITNAFIRRGFEISHPDLNHYIKVSSVGFEKKLHSMEKRKLMKAVDDNFSFNAERFDSLAEIYQFIFRCRQEKSQNLNISFNDLNAAVKNLPESYKIFTVKKGSEIIAATILVMVNKRIIYNFLPASDSNFKKWSPMVFLLANVYQYCHQADIEIFDLGISAVDNVSQSSLMDFKERVGGAAGLKLTFEKEI